jgi:hypothetical protein
MKKYLSLSFLALIFVYCTTEANAGKRHPGASKTNSFTKNSIISPVRVSFTNLFTGLTIWGPSGIVYGGGINNHTYGVAGLIGKSYTWSISNLGTIISGQGTNSIVVQYQQISENTFPFYITITAVDNNTGEQGKFIQKLSGCNSCPID